MQSQELPIHARADICFGAFCLAVRTLTFCQRMGFPTKPPKVSHRGAESNRVCLGGGCSQRLLGAKEPGSGSLFFWTKGVDFPQARPVCNPSNTIPPKKKTKSTGGPLGQDPKLSAEQGRPVSTNSLCQGVWSNRISTCDLVRG